MSAQKPEGEAVRPVELRYGTIGPRKRVALDELVAHGADVHLEDLGAEWFLSVRSGETEVNLWLPKIGGSAPRGDVRAVEVTGPARFTVDGLVVPSSDAPHVYIVAGGR